VFKKIVSGMSMGVGGFISGIIVFALAIVTTFGIPTLIVLAVLHDGPFARSDNTARFCSTLNVMTNYSASHHNLKTRAEFQSSLQYSHNKLVGAQGVPSAIGGTVTATISTSGKLLTLLHTDVNDNGLTAAQQTQFLGFYGVFKHETSTLNKWYGSNC